MSEEVSRVGRDLDAFRRHRSELPGTAAPELSAALAGLRGSEQPAVLFARLAEVVVPRVADGYRVELNDAVDPWFRSVAGAQGEDSPGPRHDPARGDHVSALSVRVAGPARGPHPSYVGIVTFTWNGREPTSTDRLLVDLLVGHAVARVDLDRLLLMLGAADERAADAAVSAIATRSINVAVGIVMHQHGCTEDEAEELLRAPAPDHPQPLYENALRVVRLGQLPDQGPGRHDRDVGPRRR